MTPRAPRPVRRMGTEIFADRRTSRRRARGDADRLAIEDEVFEWDDSDDVDLVERAAEYDAYALELDDAEMDE